MPARYDNIQDGIAIVERNNKYGFIDLRGREIIPPTYDAVTIMGYGIINVTKGEKSFNVDRSGKLVEDEDGC